jgi:hypothetical protein
MNAGEQFVATVIGIFILSINRPGSQITIPKGYELDEYQI